MAAVPFELSHSEGQEMKKVLIEPLGRQVASSALEGLQVFEPFKKYIDQCRNDGALNGRPLNDRAMSCLVNIGILELFKCLQVDSDSLAASSTGWLAVLCFEGSMTRDQAIGCCHVLDKHHHHYYVMAKFEKILNGSKGHWSARMSISELVHRVLSEKTYSNSIRLFGEKSSDSVVELLNAIGQLYISGHQVSIENLYPKVTRPLPSSTPFLSPLIKWDHEKTWPLTEFTGDASNNFYWRTVQNIEYNFDFNKPADEFLYDHTIDGRILFPGMGLLYYVWVTFCELQRSSILTTDITFRNVSFKRPIVMSKENKTRFTVRINEATGAFDVIHGDTSVSVGQIFNGTSGQVGADMDERVNQDGRLLLDNAAIYKELKVRGYHYGRHFRGLLQADHRGHWGQAVWRPIVTPTVFESTKFANKAEQDQLMMSSWIPFVDSVCHLVLLDEKNDHRNLIIPTFVSSMEIDPVQLRRVLEDGPRVAGHGTESSGVVVTAHSDRETRQVTCSGLRVSGVKAGVVNRRRQPVTLYKYQFVPFNQQCPLDSSNSQMVRQYFEHVLEAGRGKPTSYRLSSGRDGLLRKLIKCDEAIDLSNDLLVGENGPLELFMELGLKTQLDMIVSNFVPTVKTIKVNEVNGTKWPLEPKVRQYLSGHFLGDLFDVQYHLYLSKNDSSWNGVSLTEQLTLADIVLFRPSSLTDKATTIKAVESIKENGFLIVITRDVQIDARLQRATVMAAGEAIPPTRFDDSICTQFELEQISEKFCDSNLLPFRIRTYRKVNKSRHLYLSSRTVQIRAQGVFEPWLRELQECLESPQVDRIWISLEHEPNQGDSATINGLIGLVKSLRLEEGGHKVRCILNTVQNGGDTERVKVLDLVYNVQIDGRGWGSYEHFELPDIDGRNSAHFVQSSEFYLRCLKPGDLSSLTWTQLNSSPVRTGNRQIDIHYSALNFRDVMFATGRLSYEAIPYVDPQVLRDSFLGFEFSGHDQASGQRLMGLTDYKALASAIFLGHRQQDFLWPVPDQWSLEEAATVPSVYTTAYYALVVRGKLVDGESVLIHSAAGGVGLAALYVCLNRKCTVYATVGSEEKKQYLLRTFPGLEADHVLDSHSLQFEHDVLSRTNGLGVDIVLNSLAGPMLKASLRCLAQNGRFLEIGKVDFARNSKLELFELQGNQTYEGILLDALTTEDDPSGKVRKVRQTLARLLAEGIATGEVVPLTRTMFDRDQVESAFRFMGSGKHVGKVVIRIRPDGQQVSTPLCQPSLPRLTFDQNKVYIITGGLGGFGLELVQWMTTRLARRFVLTSRNGVKSDYQRYTVAKLRSQGNEIVISSLDASTMASARLLMVTGLSLGPVGGIFVLSVVLKDGLFENQTNDTFRAVIDSKACPAIHLDKLSRELCPEMAHFVAFSSLSCGRGNQGQVNYNYANNLVENVCERRHRDGLPGLAIQWGVMADVGWIEDKLAADPAFRSQLIGPSMVRFDRQQIASCLEVMEQLVHSNQPIATSCSWSPRSAGSAGPLPSGSGQDVVKLIASLIGVKEWQSLPGETTLAKLGIDSLINVEIKQVIERTTGSSMTLKQVRNLTIQGLMELNQGKKVLDLNHNHL
ncbi:Fatty acid synthase [Halotydeus destructor]|nr:Fatty acid synthase [Halotydeus destructor]